MCHREIIVLNQVLDLLSNIFFVPTVRKSDTYLERKVGKSGKDFTAGYEYGVLNAGLAIRSYVQLSKKR